jgi:hypothetical protein
VGQPVADRLAVDEGDQEKGVGLGEQFFLQLPAGPPGFCVADVRRELRHAFLMAVVNGNP